MKNRLNSPHGLNAKGIGPKIFRNTMPFLIAAIAGSLLFPSALSFPGSADNILRLTGWIMLFVGIIAYVVTLRQFIKDFSKGKLITNGIFGLSRNPLYASWILFILPAIAFITDNWSFLFAPVAMYVFFVLNIKEEEESLKQIFGEKFDEYCKRVNRLIFIPKFIK